MTTQFEPADSGLCQVTYIIFYYGEPETTIWKPTKTPNTTTEIFIENENSIDSGGNIDAVDTNNLKKSIVLLREFNVTDSNLHTFNTSDDILRRLKNVVVVGTFLNRTSKSVEARLQYITTTTAATTTTLATTTTTTATTTITNTTSKIETKTIEITSPHTEPTSSSKPEGNINQITK